MKANEIMTSAKRTFSKVGFGLQKKSPEILVGVGIVGAIASAVLACKATTKAGAIVEESKNSLADIREAKENGVTKAGESYSEEDHKKDLAIAYVQTGVKFAKLYAPAVMLGAASIASILASHNIMKKRNVALAAAYAAVDKSFKDYRDRVIERFGEQVEKELRYNIKAKEIETTVVDENGKEKKVKETVDTEVLVIGGGAIGLLMVQLAKLSGASQVLLSEPVQTRREIGLQLGANAAIDPIHEDLTARIRALTGMDGVDVVIECVGNTIATAQAFSATKRGTTVLLFSVPKSGTTHPLSLEDVYQKELTIVGSIINPDTHQRAVDLINSGRIQLAPILTHRFPIERLKDAILMQMSSESLKVLVGSNYD